MGISSSKNRLTVSHYEQPVDPKVKVSQNVLTNEINNGEHAKQIKQSMKKLESSMQQLIDMVNQPMVNDNNDDHDEKESVSHENTYTNTEASTNADIDTTMNANENNFVPVGDDGSKSSFILSLFDLDLWICVFIQFTAIFCL